MAWKVIWSDEAIEDLGVIVRRIADDDQPVAAQFGSAILDRTRVLALFPYAGRIVPEEGNEQVREIIHDPYRIIYEVDLDPGVVAVLRVWHAARGRPEV